MNKKNIKALALASIFSLSLASGKFNQNKVCAAADIVYEIFRIVGYGGLGFIGGMAFQKFLDSRNQLVNNDINHDNNTDLSSTNNKQTRVSSIPFMKFLSNNNKQTMAFPNIPLLKWQDGNCFFLAALYTLYGPENIEIYKKVANMTIEQAGRAYLDFCKTYNYVDLSRFGIDNNQFFTNGEYFNNISGYSVNECKEFRDMINGFIELCKLFVRMHDEAIPGQRFQIILENMKADEYGFEELICGGKLDGRRPGSGEPHEVFDKFVLANNPLLLAFGDRSRYATWGLGGWNQPEKITSIDQISFGIQGESGNYIMDLNGKITVNNEDYYLAAFYRRQGDVDGHILCRQPKYILDSDGNIKLDGVLKLSCLNSPHTYDKKNSMFDVLNEQFNSKPSSKPQIIGGANFGFRFVPKEEMLKHKEFYVNN